MTHFVYCTQHSAASYLKASDLYPSSTRIVEVCDGYLCFETEDEYFTWLNQL